MGLEDLTKALEEGKFKDAYLIAEQLKKDGVPTTAINFYIYPIFKVYLRRDRAKAEEIAKEFINYKFECWLG